MARYPFPTARTGASATTPFSSTGSLTVLAMESGGDPIIGYWSHARIASGRGLMLLSGFAGDSVGPDLLFVQFAARVAAAGWHCLRLDFRGRGLSGGRPSDTTFDMMVEDATVAAEEFRRRASLTTLVAGGLCLGTLTALSLEPRIVLDGLLLWSPATIGTPQNLALRARRVGAELGQYIRSARRLETWRRALRGDVSFRGVGGVLSNALAPRAGETAITMGRARTDSLRRLLATPSRLSTLCIVGSLDPDAEETRTTYRAVLARRPAGRLQMIEGADHNFASETARERLSEESLAFLDTIQASTAGKWLGSSV